MQEIADEMGILKGSLYHYMRTKEDLVWMVMKPPLHELVQNAGAILEADSIPVIERLPRAMTVHARSFETHYPHMFVMTRENGETLSPARRKELDSLRREYARLWRSAIAAGIESGELRQDIDVRLTVHAIFGMLNWMFRWFKPGKIPADVVAASFAEILVTGISADADADAGRADADR